jgi:hypothetical protein
MGAGLWMLWVAADSAASADRLLLSPSEAASAYLKSLGHVPLRPLAQYLAAERNRSLFEVWGVVQIALGGAFFFFLLFGTRLGKFPLALALLMLLIAVGERMALIPGMEMVGRATEFNLDPSELWVQHGRVGQVRDGGGDGGLPALAADPAITRLPASGRHGR